jgi:hypothetical protein
MIDKEYDSVGFKRGLDSWKIGHNENAFPRATFYPAQIASKRFLHELIDLLPENKVVPGTYGPARMARKWC